MYTVLVKEVIEKGLCAACGACVAVCPKGMGEMRGLTPTFTEHKACKVCSLVCPVYNRDTRELEEKFLGRVKEEGEVLGVYKGVYACKTRLEEVGKVAQDGGVVSTLLIAALEEGVIEGAVVSGLSDDKPLWPEPILATSKGEVLKAAGSRYTPSPNLLMLREAKEKKVKSLAVVGTPCHVTAARRIQARVPGYGRPVRYVLGLFCTETFNYEGLIGKLKEKGADPNHIVKTDIKRRFIATLDTGETVEIPLKELEEHVRGSCRICTDFSAELADISVGSVGSPVGWSTVIVRTKEGEELFNLAVNKGLLEVKKIDEVKPGLNLVLKLARAKLKRAAKP